MDLLELLKPLPTEDEMQALVRECVPEKTYVYCVDYSDNLNHKAYEAFAEEVLQGAEQYHFYHKVSECLWDWDIDLSYETDNIRSDMSSRFEGYDEGQIEDLDELINEQEDYIRELIFDRDHSKPVDDLIRNTSDYTVRVHLTSNYEGLVSGWDLGQQGVRYDEYMKQMIDALNLNPAKVKVALEKHRYLPKGSWPNKANRDGKELVDYELLAQEIDNSAGLCQLCIIGTLDLDQLDNFTGKVSFSKGAPVGLFGSWSGTGSVFEMELLHDLTVDTKKKGETCYDGFSAHIDSQNGYSINETYGPTRAFWGGSIGLS